MLTILKKEIDKETADDLVQAIANVLGGADRNKLWDHLYDADPRQYLTPEQRVQKVLVFIQKTLNESIEWGPGRSL